LSVSFARSTLIANNDFGWRGWLPGQFVLLVWGTDIISYLWIRKSNLHIVLFRKPLSIKGTRVLFGCLLLLGVATSLQDVLLLRTWPILLDTGLIKPTTNEKYIAAKIFEARKLYGIIDNATSKNMIMQSEPTPGIDRASGLYGTRNSVYSSLTLYGVPAEKYEPLREKVGAIFDTPYGNWKELDHACQQYSIDILIIKNTDLLWKSINKLLAGRDPLFSGNYYTAFYCGASGQTHVNFPFYSG
jgi:hypothetical protein